MNKRLLSLLLCALLLCTLLPGAAWAEGTIIANLGSADAGSTLDRLLGTTEEGVASVTGGSLPDGCAVSTETREGGAYHYLRGTPMAAGDYEFTLTVAAEGGEEPVATLTCALSVAPAQPAISVSPSVDCSVGEDARVSVSASVADNGALSYQWSVDGVPIENATAPELQVSTASAGSRVYVCAVTNTNNDRRVTVSSPGISVTVSEPVITSLSVAAMPNKREYTVGDTLDAAGLILTAHYSSGAEITVTSGYTLKPTLLENAGTQQITATYEDMICTFPVLVAEAEEVVERIEILTPPTKTEYLVSDWLDTAGMTLRVTTNKDSYDVTTGFTCMPKVFETDGVQTVTVSYGGKTAEFLVSVKPTVKTVESISIVRRPTKLSYDVGDTFDPDGMVLSVVTNMGTEEVSEGFTCTPMQLTQAGSVTVTVSYEGATTTLELLVDAPGAVPDEPPATAEPEPTPTPAATHTPDVRPERKNSTLVPVIVIAAVVALAALLGYVALARQEKLRALLQKLREKFGKTK